MQRKLTLVAFCLTLVGCSRSDLATVAGSITVDGQPAQNGYVSFFAADGRAPTAGGRIVDGHYTAEVKPGLCKVQVRVPKETGQRKLYDAPNSPMAKTWAESLPAKFNEATELQLDVKPGYNEQNYDLSTK